MIERLLYAVHLPTEGPCSTEPTSAPAGSVLCRSYFLCQTSWQGFTHGPTVERTVGVGQCSWRSSCPWLPHIMTQEKLWNVEHHWDARAEPADGGFPRVPRASLWCAPIAIAAGAKAATSCHELEVGAGQVSVPFTYFSICIFQCPLPHVLPLKLKALFFPLKV